MRILGNYTKKKELLAMLIELDMDLHKKENIAMDKRDFEKAKEYIELRDCLDKLMKGIEK